MSRSALVLSLALTFVTGCLAASIAHNFVVPPVRAGTNPQKWEYTCTVFARATPRMLDGTAEVTLAKLGRQGWEMSGGRNSNGWICFKRPLS